MRFYSKRAQRIRLGRSPSTEDLEEEGTGGGGGIRACQPAEVRETPCGARLLRSLPNQRSSRNESPMPAYHECHVASRRGKGPLEGVRRGWGRGLAPPSDFELRVTGTAASGTWMRGPRNISTLLLLFVCAFLLLCCFIILFSSLHFV